ncbi:MAG: ABC transporter substrate-binding protein [Pseudomonadota bacterium]
MPSLIPFRAFALFLGLIMPVALQAATLLVGQVAPLTGLEGPQGRAYAAGIQLGLELANRDGSAGGHTFVLVSSDDGGRAADTVSLTAALLRDKRPIALAGYFGGPNVAALNDSGLLAKERIALVGYRSADIRAEAPWMYNVRASLHDEIGKIVGHLATVGASRIALVNEEGQSAAALIAAVGEATRKAGIRVVTQARIPAGTVKVGKAAQTVAAQQPVAIIVIANAAATASFIEHYRAIGGGAQIFAHSGADLEQLIKQLAEEQMPGVSIAQVLPNPYKLNVPLVQQLQDAIRKSPQAQALTPSYAMLEGFIAAKVIVEAARRVGSRVTRETLAAALENMQTYDLGGYMVSYRPDARGGSKYVELTIISKAGKIRQ